MSLSVIDNTTSSVEYATTKENDDYSYESRFKAVFEGKRSHTYPPHTHPTHTPHTHTQAPHPSHTLLTPTRPLNCLLCLRIRLSSYFIQCFEQWTMSCWQLIYVFNKNNSPLQPFIVIGGNPHTYSASFLGNILNLKLFIFAWITMYTYNSSFVWGKFVYQMETAWVAFCKQPSRWFWNGNVKIQHWPNTCRIHT